MSAEHNPWPLNFDRAWVRGAIEEAAGVSLSVDDPMPDSLIARAQELKLDPTMLKIFIHDQPRIDWSQAALARWAIARGFIEAKAEQIA
ncbi:MAG TPA: hypothetical protein VG273_16355 [Bryobacteraceae bacterium]|jgi:hypothetical protein|nr:hypothetical protein [Bryobacteraceae bacterium]